MYEVMLVILHRPFVSEGHLYIKDNHTVAVESFSICVDAATSIVALFRIYDRDFSIKRAPYLIAYATYVAATIHVRVAAQLEAPSHAHSMLQFCLYVFEQNRETNSAVKRAELVVGNLMKRMGVQMAAETNLNLQNNLNEVQSPRFPTSGILDLDSADRTNDNRDIDIDMVIQSFNPYMNTWDTQSQPTAMMNSRQDFSGSISIPEGMVSSYDHNTLSQSQDTRAWYPPVYDLLVGFPGNPDDDTWTYTTTCEPGFTSM